MKYIIALLLVSFLFITACNTNDVVEPVVDDQGIDVNVGDEEIVDEIMPGLINADEEPEIGEMI